MINFKSSTFVGREMLFNEALNHCTVSENPTTLILHGEPGCGKSGFLSAISSRCIHDLRKNDNFVFVHAVDSCPGSNVLRRFLKRLQVNLRQFRRVHGEINLSPDPPEEVTNLISEHHAFIEKSAKQYPSKLFVIIVDAVNQFHESLRSWDMWWLMRETCPPNVRFIISTLNSENNTFTNAKDACPSAKVLHVGLMSKEDLEDMIGKTLQRYNKKLTTTDDRLLGNQMEILLSKSSSPLYLIASCEALRRFGIFENVTEYIRSLPTTISDLFSFLLDEWCTEYGKMFTEDVAGLICSSKDGLLENQINDLLRFKEERESVEGELLYDASFSRIYDAISSFLAAGGGGYLRFFHDQLKYTVRKKFLGPKFALETNKWMRDFFYSIIEPQLCEKPIDKPPDYYKHAMNQLIYHQIKASSGDLSCLKISLRNIYFVRERIIFDQENLLNEEYLKCLSEAKDAHTIKALKDWSKFVQLYAGYIKEFPQFCYSMASNQSPSSFVTKDTKTFLQTQVNHGYPLDWINIPQVDDPIAVKYRSQGIDVCASSPKEDIIAVATIGSALIIDQSSGELIHSLKVNAYSVYLSDDYANLFAGDDEGKIHCFDTGSGAWKYSTSNGLGQAITWVGKGPDGNLAAGTGWKEKTITWDENNDNSSIIIFKEENCETVTQWSTNAPGYHYCYNNKTNMIFSSHKGFIRGWNEKGMLTHCSDGTHDIGSCCYCLASHPTENNIITGDSDLNVKEWVIGPDLQLKRTINVPCISGWAFGGIWSLTYDLTGDSIFVTEPHTQSVQIYGQDNKLVNTLKGHSDCINKIACVPKSNYLITCDRGDCTIAWNLPENEIACATFTQEIDEKILWCGFTITEEKFITVTDKVIRAWDATTGEVLKSAEFAGHYYSGCAVHPDGRHIGVPCNMVVKWFRIDDLTQVSVFNVLDDSDGSITDLALSEDGSRLLVTECKNMNSQSSIAAVWDSSDVTTEGKDIYIISDYGGRAFSCDIYKDRGMIAGHSGTLLFRLESGEHLVKINNGCFFSKFLRNKNEFLIQDGSNMVRCDASDGREVCRYTGHTDGITHAVLLKNELQLITSSEDGSLRIFDMASGSCIYGFFNHRAQQFKHIAVNSAEDRIIAPNTNGMLYILHPVQGLPHAIPLDFHDIPTLDFHDIPPHDVPLT